MSLITQIEIYTIFLLFIFAALLSVAETSIIGMSRIKVIAHIRNNHPKAKYLKVWMKEPNKLLATLSVCVNAVAIATSTVAAFLSLEIARFTGMEESLVATVMAAIITVILIIFGEISPKIFAIHNTEKLGLTFIAPVVYLYIVMKPVTELFVKISNFTIKLFGGTPTEGIPVVSAKDISTVIDVSMEEGLIGEQEKSMMSSILELKELQVKQVMVPRTSMVGIDINWDIDKIIDMIIEDGYSRMPVYKENYDNIIGIIYTKDMLSMIKNRGLIIFHDLIRVPYFVPETKNVRELLKEFKKGNIHMAIVVDEFGGTSGIVTLEDILEEIVGEIKDEYDIDESSCRKISDNIYEVDGILEVDKLNETLKIDIPREEDVNTIGGFILALSGRVPKKGEIISFGNIDFEILKSDARKIEKIKITLKQENSSVPASQE